MTNFSPHDNKNWALGRHRRQDLFRNSGDNSATTADALSSTSAESLSLDLDSCNKNTNKDRRQSKRTRKNDLIRRNLNGASMGFSTASRMIVLLTMCCWFGSLVYAHYRLTLVLQEQEQEQFQEHKAGRRQTIAQNLHLLQVDADDQVISSKVRKNQLSNPEPPGSLSRQQQREKAAIGHKESTPETVTYPTNKQHTNGTTQPVPDVLEWVRQDSLLAPWVPADPTPSLQQTFTKADLAGRRFIIFEGERLVGQGVGNLMSGLLGVHLLGEEFNRTVCIVQDFHFHKAFEPIDPTTAPLCNDIFDVFRDTQPDDIVSMINFEDPPDECKLKLTMASDKQAIFMIANTYVRWRAVPPAFFFQFYKPRQELLNELSYDPNHHPSIVVHLRRADTRSDRRKGLDEVSLKALGDLLSIEKEKPFLVSNNVEWFDYFHQNYGWRHPAWDEIKHSALAMSWSSKRKDNEPKLTPDEDKAVQQMQLWADWYSILTAKRVYHTHSDFSQSAIHWMGMDPETHEALMWSRTILDYDHKDGELKFTKETWVIDPVMKPLVERVGDELANCGKQPRRNMHRADLTSDVNREFVAKHLGIGPRGMEAYRQFTKQNANPRTEWL